MNKQILLSKTFWFGLLTALSTLIPVVKSAIVDNPASFTMIWGALTIVLRYVTKDKVVLLP